MWFFEICVTNLLGRKYQNKCLIIIIKTWYTFSIKLVLRKLGTDYYGGDAKIYFDYPVYEHEGKASGLVNLHLARR